MTRRGRFKTLMLSSCIGAAHQFESNVPNHQRRCAGPPLSENLDSGPLLPTCMDLHVASTNENTPTKLRTSSESAPWPPRPDSNEKHPPCLAVAKCQRSQPRY